MNEFDVFMTDKIQVWRGDADISGCRKASVQGNKITVNDDQLDVQEGDVVTRELPNGTTTYHKVDRADWHQDPFGAGMSHWAISTHRVSGKVGAAPDKDEIAASLVSSAAQHSVSVQNSSNIQINFGSVFTLIQSLDEVKEAVGRADAPEDQKRSVLEMINNFVSHPLVSSIVGGVAGGAVGGAGS